MRAARLTFGGRLGYAGSMRGGSRLGRSLLALTLVGAALAVVPPSPVGAAPAYEGGGEYHPLTPARIFDSRPASAVNDVSPLGIKPLGSPPATFHVDVLGQGGVPDDPDTVLAVVLNIAVTEPSGTGYLQAYGKGAAAGISAVVNFTPGRTVPNLAIVRPGADGDVTIGLFGLTGSAHVVIDVFGWFSTSALPAGDGARLVPVTPARILDTRDGTNYAPAGTPLGAQQSLTLPIRGVDAVSPTVPDVVPDSDTVVGVVLNVTAVTRLATSNTTYLSVVPDDVPEGEAPQTANLNIPFNAVKANLVMVPVGADGKVRIYNRNGDTHVVADVVGYLQTGADPATRAGRVVPLTAPFRTFDTREALWGGARLGPGQAEDWSFSAFANSVTIGSEWVGNQSAVIGNLTVASVIRQYATVPVSTFMTAYPPNVSLPLASNINTTEGPAVPNMAVVRYGPNYTVRVYNLNGYAHYVFDASAVVLAD